VRDEQQPGRSEIENILCSDVLRKLKELLELFPALRSVLPQLLQLSVVIDANIVQSELWWRLKNRPRPALRSSLEEALASGVLIAYAPHHLEDEIREHLEQLAVRTKRPVAEVEREWTFFRRHIHFHTGPKGAGGDLSDPDDIAYLDTLHDVAARGIYTRDTHFQESKAPLIFIAMDIRNPMDLALRRYARSSAVRIGLAFGSSVSAFVSVELLLVLGKLLKTLVTAFKRLSPGAQLLIFAGVIALLAHPKSRAKLKELWGALQETVRPLLWDTVVDAMYQFAEATKTAELAHREIQAWLPEARRRPLIAHARAVCLVAGKPLRDEVILRKVFTNGYVSGRGGSVAYLRRVLRADAQFVETATGWTLGKSGTK
jgi:predicted nucleic acid-binding protein